MSNPVVHFEITGRNGKKLQEFYAKLFDWSIDANNPMNYGMVAATEPGIGGGIGEKEDSGYVTIYVQVGDLQAYLDRAEKLGGKTMVPPTEIPNTVTFALFTDPEGNIMGLVKG